MKQLLLFGGTTEGRLLAVEAAHRGFAVTLCVATAYGEAQLPLGHPGIVTHTGRMETIEMLHLMQSEPFSSVVDATHPYAVVVSGNICTAARAAALPYWRLLRPASAASQGPCRYADNIEAACAMLLAMAGAGNVLAATGSKEIAAYTCLANYRERLYARVLPVEASVRLCRDAGLDETHILVGKGPFTVAQNEAVLRKYQIQTLVTKDGGSAGGFAEKLEAAAHCGTDVIVVRRPVKEDGFTWQEIILKLEECLF